MKQDIHPQYHSAATITCACGAIYTIGSTMEEISIDLCKKCHPFYTGTQKILDTAHRVEKFQTRATAQTDEKTIGRTAKRQLKAASRKPKFEVEETKGARIKKTKTTTEA